MDTIDFRSDTVSWPTPAMRAAMAAAPVGDDVYGEDPTVHQLEALAAQKVGHEAALFVPSGTMGNLAAILTHAARGESAIVGEDAHTYQAEAGGMAVLGGILPQVLPTDAYGCFSLTDLKNAILPEDEHYTRTRLILLENSYGSKSGYPLPPDYFAAVRAIAQQHDVRVHLDGARLFNAAVALNLDPHQLTQHVDSVSFCLSKGLCAPVGSLLCGSAPFIREARRARKILGGGMRQAGVLAAAGLVALNEMIERLADDHAQARLLAEGLAHIPGIAIDLAMVRTNMVFFEVTPDTQLTADNFIAQLRERANIWLGAVGPRHFRAVTHYWISAADVERFLESTRAIILSGNR